MPYHDKVRGQTLTMIWKSTRKELGYQLLPCVSDKSRDDCLERLENYRDHHLSTLVCGSTNRMILELT
jgi:hypothetical protein